MLSTNSETKEKEMSVLDSEMKVAETKHLQTFTNLKNEKQRNVLAPTVRLLFAVF